MSQSWVHQSCHEVYNYLKTIVTPTLHIEILANSKSICTIDGIQITNQHTLTLANYDEVHDEVLQALKYVGAIPLNFSFIDKNSFSKVEKLTIAEDFVTWYNTQTSKKMIFIDTNIMLHRIFSSLELALGSSLASKDFEIPRLTILEMERQANAKNNEGTSTTNHKVGLKKRKTLLGFSELLYLKNKGAQHMPELPLETLTGFSNISGDGFTDAWIRREIKDRRFFLMRAGSATFQLFFTADMVNALSALAEGIDTVYISPVPEWEKHIQQINLSQISQLICFLATLLNDITINVNSNKSNIKGFWSGITTSNIINRDILVQAIP